MTDDRREAAPVHLPEIITLTGETPGPVLAVLGGVHGDEFEGVIAARQLAHRLRTTRFRGTVRIAAPAHPSAWAASRRASPDDELNLAREFPGDPDGSPTQRVAAHLTTELIAGADLLVDLHSAGRALDMPLLAGYNTGSPALRSAARAAVEAFAAPLLWRHPGIAPGRSLAAAAALGIPSLYVEGRGGGQIRESDLQFYVEGLHRVMQYLGMVNDAPPATSPSVWVAGDGDTDGGIESDRAGYLVTAAEVGQHVGAGQLLGSVLDLDGRPVTQVVAPQAGIVMLMRREARVVKGDTVAIVAPVLAEAEDDHG